MRGGPANPVFVRALQRALQHLYDPAELRRSPLVELLGANQREDPTSYLRHVLTEAIQSLKPRADVPPQANAWRTYHVLRQRYVESFTMADIAASLAVSPRQLRRLHALALQALADYLWASHSLAEKAPDRPPSPSHAAASPESLTQAQELEWLKRSSPNEAVDVAAAIESSLTVVAPLMAALAVRAECTVPEGLPPLAVQPTAFRHALLSILTPAIRSSREGCIHIAARAHLPQVWITLEASGGEPGAASLSEEHSENLRIAQQLVALSGGSVELAPGEGAHAAFTIRLALPAAGQIAVLVVDDNADALQLYERYLTGTRYRFTGISDPRQALAVAEKLEPQVIVLDLMLPQVDGWELLGRLRAHPKTRQVPIVVCTILPQEDLALALGAAVLIRKPVSLEGFLATLERVLDSEERREL